MDRSRRCDPLRRRRLDRQHYRLPERRLVTNIISYPPYYRGKTSPYLCHQWAFLGIIIGVVTRIIGIVKQSCYNWSIENLNRELNVNIRKKENSLNQFALDDNSVQLSADIGSLQDRLEEYVTTLNGANIKADNGQICTSKMEVEEAITHPNR